MTSEKLVLFGASKGGTIALSLLNEFPEAKFVITVPQLNLDHYREGRPQLNGSLISLFRKYHFDYEKSLDIVNNIYSNPNTEIFMFNGINDQLSNNGRFIVNNDLKNLKVINSDIWHNGVTNFTEIIWKNMLVSNKKIKTVFYCPDDVDSLNGIELLESGEIIEDQYTDIMPIIEFWSLDGEVMVFATPIAKLKGSEGKINKFVNADIDNYLYDYQSILTKSKYLIKLSVYSARGKIYYGEVRNYSGQTCIYDSTLNSILWLT